MGLQLKIKKDSDEVGFKDMKPGQIGVIIDTNPEYNFNKLVMRTYEGDFVNLGNGDVWSGRRKLDINVRLLPPGTEFIID